MQELVKKLFPDLKTDLIKPETIMYSPKKFDFKYLQPTDGLRQTDREEGKVHCKAQAKRKEQQRDSV